MSEKPWYCASSAPESATRPFDIISPNTLEKLVLMPWARAMASFAPVARSEQPLSVPKYQYINPITMATASASTKMGFESPASRT